MITATGRRMRCRGALLLFVVAVLIFALLALALRICAPLIADWLSQRPEPSREGDRRAEANAPAAGVTPVEPPAPRSLA